MEEILFLTVQEVMNFHESHIQQFGGSFGIRDPGLLEAAVIAPQATFDGCFLCEDIFHMAAVYAHGIIKNHPFIDGNRRTGMTTSLVFLKYNNINIEFRKDEFWYLAIALATSKITVETMAELLRKKLN
jgi:death on curing protein